MLCDSTDKFTCKEVFFGVRMIYDVTRLGKICPLSPIKVGVNRQFQTKMPKYRNVFKTKSDQAKIPE